MTLYINSPAWFSGIDSAIELLVIVVAFIVAAYGYKVYILSNQKKYKYFAAAFGLIGLSYIFKIISELVIYKKETVMQSIGPFLISRVVIEPVIWVHVSTHTIFRLLNLFAFFVLLVVMLDIKNKQTLILLTYFMILVTVVSVYAHIIFYLTQILLTAMLLLHFYNNYQKHRTRQSLLVTLAFMGMFISNILLTFMMYDPNIYAIGEAFQLAGFSMLLYAFILVKKK